MRYLNSSLVEKPIQVLIGLIIRLVASAIANVVVDITEVLTDDEKLRAPVAEPLLPMTDHIGIELKFSATSDLACAFSKTASASIRWASRRSGRSTKPS